MKLEFTREWLRKAENDFRAAQHLCRSGEGYAEGATFHCQQAAEKYLKALLVWHQIEFPKTHDIKELLNLVAGVDPRLLKALGDATELTPYGVEYRYPGDSPQVTGRDAKRALTLSSLVRKEIRGLFPKEVLQARRKR